MHTIEKKVGYKFRNPLLLAEALTHSSIGHETKTHPFDNQRLEFLGDAVLQLVFTQELYRLFPNAPEGDLTKLRAKLVSREALAVHAKKIALGNHILMGKGEEASGGRRRASILADAFEALTGAIYLDGGLEPTNTFLLRLAKNDLARCAVDTIENNPKGKLQEILQALTPEPPTYEIVSSAGPEHRKRFTVRAIWSGIELGKGHGGSKKLAEISAAKTALKNAHWKGLENATTTNEQPVNKC